MKKLCFIICAIFNLMNVVAQDVGLDWAGNFGSNSSESSTGIITDNAGNAYVMGIFPETMDFDFGDGSFVATSVGTYDFFITKYSNTGEFVWVKTLGAISHAVQGYDICYDGLENIYITGGYSGTIDFDPGIGTFLMPSAGGADNFILKLDLDGNFVWAKSVSAMFRQIGFSIVTSASGNIYNAGIFQGTVDFDPGIGVFEMTSAGYDDVYIQKFDSDGNFIWAKSIGNEGYQSVSAIFLDAEESLLIGGSYEGICDFDPGVSTFNYTSSGSSDNYILKLNSSGNFDWAVSFGTATYDDIEYISIDNEGNVYSTGFFLDVVDVDPSVGVTELIPNGSTDLFIQKLDNDGNFIWAKGIGGINEDNSSGLAIDESNNVYVTGYYSSTVDFDPNLGVFNLTSNGNRDIFIQKLDQDGNFIWAKGFGGTYGDESRPIKLGLENDVYITGGMGNTVDFDPNLNEYNLTSNGYEDVYILKLQACTPNATTDVITACVSHTWIDGITYYEDNNVATFTLSNLEGCDSIVTLDLTIHEVDITTTVLEDVIMANVIDASYQWLDCNDEFALIPGETNQTYSPSEDGDYAVKVTIGSCSDTSACIEVCSPIATTDFITSCVSFTWINDTTYYENNNSASVILSNVIGCDSVVTLDLTINEVDITTTAIGGVLSSNATGATYQWLDCNDAYSEIAGATNQTYTPIDDGDYAVKVTIGSCSDTSACIAVDGVGLNDNNNLSQIHLYPNPNNGLFNINLDQVQATLIQISSANGTIIYSNTTNLTGIHQIALNITAGLYFVDVLTESGTYQMKLVVE